MHLLVLVVSERMTTSQEVGQKNIFPSFPLHFSDMSITKSFICHFYMNMLTYITLMPTCDIRPKMEVSSIMKKFISNGHLAWAAISGYI